MQFSNDLLTERVSATPSSQQLHGQIDCRRRFGCRADRLHWDLPAILAENVNEVERLARVEDYRAQVASLSLNFFYFRYLLHPIHRLTLTLVNFFE